MPSSSGLKSLLAILLAVTSFRSAVADWNDVPTGSMKPTILEGDRVFVNKLAYDLKVPFTKHRLAAWAAPERGDVVIFFSPVDETRLIKRVVAIGGDEIEVRGNRVLLNGESLTYAGDAPLVSDDFYAENPEAPAVYQERLDGHAHPVVLADGHSVFGDVPKTRVPEGHVFVLGDNRGDSADSRSFGFVPLDQIAGRAVGVAVSVNPDAGYSPRWRRLLSALP